MDCLVAFPQSTRNNLIYVENAVEVVAFVLEDDGSEALHALGGVAKGQRGVGLAVGGGTDQCLSNINIAPAHHISAEAGDGKAAFRAGGHCSIQIRDAARKQDRILSEIDP